MYPTERDTSIANALYEEWEYNPRKLREAIAEALAEARQEGRDEEGRKESRVAAADAEEKMCALEELREKNYSPFRERERSE